MKRILALLMLIGVVLASGCVGQTTTTPVAGTNGLVISDFSPDSNKVMAGDTINLNLEVQNVGGAPADTVTANIYGVPIGPGAFDWSLESGEQTFTLANQLLPPEEGIPGEIATYVWTLRAPKGVKSDTTNTFDLRINYDYSTDVTGVLTFVSQDYWNSLTKEEKAALASKAGVSQLTQTGGPLSIILYAGQRSRPFVIDPSVTMYKLRITINNVGGGEPSGPIRLNQASSSTGVTIACPPEISDPGVTLSRGKTASFSCDINLGEAAMAIANKQDFTISLSFNYGWRVDSSSDITVQKALS
jgi:hypothetical protein